MRKSRQRRLPRGLPGLTGSPARTSRSRTSHGRLARQLDAVRSRDLNSKSKARTASRRAPSTPNREATETRSSSGKSIRARSGSPQSGRTASQKNTRRASGTPPLDFEPRNWELAHRASAKASPRRRADSAVKTSRAKEAGLQSRQVGHASASGRRAQGRRDSRS